MNKLSRKDLRLIGSNLKLLLDSPPVIKRPNPTSTHYGTSYDASEELDVRVSDVESDDEEQI